MLLPKSIFPVFIFHIKRLFGGVARKENASIGQAKSDFFGLQIFYSQHLFLHHNSANFLLNIFVPIDGVYLIGCSVDDKILGLVEGNGFDGRSSLSAIDSFVEAFVVGLELNNLIECGACKN